MKGNFGGGSKFLPGGGKGGNIKGQPGKNQQPTHSQTNRTMHTNQSHMGSGKGGK